MVATVLVTRYMNETKEEKQIAKKLAIDYIQTQYKEIDPLELTKMCRPILGFGDYQMVIKDTKGEDYYLFMQLTRGRTLQWVDDLTVDVRHGASSFPCG